MVNFSEAVGFWLCLTEETPSPKSLLPPQDGGGAAKVAKGEMLQNVPAVRHAQIMHLKPLSHMKPLS